MLTKLQVPAMLAGRKEMEQTLIAKAWSDPAFKAQLTTDPRGAIKAALGIDVPADITIQVIEEKPGVLMLAVPAARAEQDELSDHELEAVAVGKMTKAQKMAQDHLNDQ